MIDTVPHTKKTWPSGLQSFEDSTHRIAEDCGRQEVTIEGAIEAQHDMPVYAWLPGQYDLHLEPWRYLEGLDPYITGDRVDVWFESGRCMTVDINDCKLRFFVDAAKLENIMKSKTLSPGDTFRAKSPIGMTKYDYMIATFTVDKVSESGIVYATGECDDVTLLGKPFRGKKIWKNRRFKFNDRAERYDEFQPTMRGHGFYQVED